MAGENELVDEERLARQEEGRDEGVAWAQFGIDGLHHLEPHVAQIAEHTATLEGCCLLHIIRWTE